MWWRSSRSGRLEDRVIACLFLILLLAPLWVSSSPALSQSITTSQVWSPQGRLASAIAVTATSSTTQLPSSGNVAWLCNTGAKDAYVGFGTSNSISTTATTGSWLKSATCGKYNLWPQGPGSLVYTYVALICGGTDSTTVAVETGQGTPPQ